MIPQGVVDGALVAITVAQLVRHLCGKTTSPLLFAVGVGLCLTLVAWGVGAQLMKGDKVVVTFYPTPRELALAVVGYSILTWVDLIFQFMEVFHVGGG